MADQPTPPTPEQAAEQLRQYVAAITAQRDRARGDLNISVQRTRAERRRADELAAENRRLREHIAACPTCGQVTP